MLNKCYNQGLWHIGLSYSPEHSILCPLFALLIKVHTTAQQILLLFRQGKAYCTVSHLEQAWEACFFPYLWHHVSLIVVGRGTWQPREKKDLMYQSLVPVVKGNCKYLSLVIDILNGGYSENSSSSTVGYLIDLNSTQATINIFTVITLLWIRFPPDNIIDRKCFWH